MTAAREYLRAAKVTLSEGSFPASISSAYYAMLYAARTALSEEDLYAKTHSGVWGLFSRTFVKGDRFDPELSSRAATTQHDREDVDYDAVIPSEGKARDTLDTAEEFVQAVVEMLGSAE